SSLMAMAHFAEAEAFERIRGVFLEKQTIFWFPETAPEQFTVRLLERILDDNHLQDVDFQSALTLELGLVYLHHGKYESARASLLKSQQSRRSQRSAAVDLWIAWG